MEALQLGDDDRDGVGAPVHFAGYTGAGCAIIAADETAAQGREVNGVADGLYGGSAGGGDDFLFAEVEAAAFAGVAAFGGVAHQHPDVFHIGEAGSVIGYAC